MMKIMKELDGIKECLCTLNKLPKKCAVVIAPMFNDENITDGYFQRIQAIDQAVLFDFFRVYINMQEDYTAPIQKSQFKISVYNSCMEINLDPRIKWQAWFLKKLIRKCTVAYVHCALRMIFRSTGAAIRHALTCGNICIIWDVHGAVPEEFLMYEDLWGAQEARESETFLARNADVIVVVNEHMKRHLQNIYGNQIRGTFVILPIFNLDIDKKLYSDEDKVVQTGEGLTVVYAGGLQRWQCIEEMQNAIEHFGDKASYEMCVPEPEHFMEMWGGRKTPKALNVSEKNHEELFRSYRKCHMGFVLRKKSVVNEVACPTKLIEYIQHGIIPIMDSPEVGDFVELGMQYLSLNDFNKGIIPTAQQRSRIALLNLDVLGKLLQQNRRGVDQLRAAIARAPYRHRYFVQQEKHKQEYAYILRGKNNDEYIENLFGCNEGRKLYLVIENPKCVSNLTVLEMCTIFCYRGININGQKYGGTDRDFKEFCERYGIQLLYDGKRKLTVHEFLAEEYTK